MKKLFTTLVVSAGIFTAGYSQQSLDNNDPIRYFNEGKNMFDDNNYVGAEHSLSEFKKRTKDDKLMMEADYMIVSSKFFRGGADAELQLKDFLDTYSETYHRNELCFYIGTCHFNKKEWEKALFWLDQSDVNRLNIQEQEDHSFRKAYAALQTGNKAEAKRLFGLLSMHSKKYSDAASFYLAYIDFHEGNYDQALRVFNLLKNKPEYREESLFFLTQGYFINNDLRNAVSEGESYTRNYPNSKNTKEIYRILGNSYNRLYDVNSSIANYEKYISLESNPFPQDMYMLGVSYYQSGNNQRAADVLKYAASTDNQLGQAAYMQLGQAYLKLNDTTNALLAFDAASRVKFDRSISEAALYNYALLVHQTSLSVFDQSVTVLQRFLTEYPSSKYADQINDILASTLLSTKNYNAALNAIDAIRSPGRQVLMAKQIIYFRLGTQDFINSDYVSASRNFDACINMGNYDPKTRNESYFWKGEIAYRAGDYSVAERNYQTYIKGASRSDENYGLALYNLGYTYFKLKQYNNSLQNMRQYAAQESNRKSSTYADALNRMGDCYLYNRNFADAENAYSQAVSADPSNADYAEFQKAFVMGLRRNYNGKISALDDMMRRYPNSSYLDDALYEKSRALVMLNRDRDAINVIEKLLKDYPQSPLNQQAGVQLGQLYFNVGNHQKAIEAYKRVIGNYPNSAEARISIKSLESVYKEINDINAYASYVNSLGVGTVITTSRQDTLSYLAAENVYMKGNKANSKNALQTYLQSYPNGAYSGDAHYLLGFMAFEENDKNTALREFNYVVSANNRKYINDALIYVSGIEFDRKNYQAAYDTYKKLDAVASTTDNKNVAQLGMLRSAYLMQNNNEVIEAATLLLGGSKVSPEVVNEARYYRAKARLNMNMRDAAVSDLKELAKDARNLFGAEANFMLADVYYQNKSYDEAIKQIQSFMKQGTPHEFWMAKALIVLSDCYAAKGEDFQAKQYLESLKANYKGTEQEISNAIDQRLNK
ncbi:MAG: tetratricopeptide repeat protein [Dysgonomonas sp.]